MENPKDIEIYKESVKLNNSVIHETGMMISIEVVLEPELFNETKSDALKVYDAIINLLNNEGIKMSKSREKVKYDKFMEDVDGGVDDDDDIGPRRSKRNLR